MFNKFFELSNLQFEYKMRQYKESYEILVGYNQEEKVSLVINVTIKDNNLYLIKDTDKKYYEGKK